MFGFSSPRSPSHRTPIAWAAQADTAGSTQQRTTAKAPAWPWVKSTPQQMALGLLFGVIFGFLLQKGGVAKFDILIGVLLLENFVVVQVMLSAIVTGMIGVYFLERAGLVETQIKETVFGSNIVGGLLFGVGFGLLAYCPGTNAAALGQGNLDAGVGVLGMLLGSYLFALASKYNLDKVNWGKRGKQMLNEVVGISRGAFIAIAAPLLVGILVVIELLTR